MFEKKSSSFQAIQTHCKKKRKKRTKVISATHTIRTVSKEKESKASAEGGLAGSEKMMELSL